MKTKGYHNPEDGGGNSYLRDVTGKEADNGDLLKIIALLLFFAAYALTAYFTINHYTNESKMAIIYKLSTDGASCEEVIDYVNDKF